MSTVDSQWHRVLYRKFQVQVLAALIYIYIQCLYLRLYSTRILIFFLQLLIFPRELC